MPQIDRAAIKNYFKPFPVWAVLCIIIGVPLIALYGIGLSPIAVGVLALVFNKKPTDQQMDEWLAEEIKFLNEKALSKLGIDASHCVRQPIVVYGPRVENTGGANLLVTSGKDLRVSYSPLDISIMNCGQDQLFCYQCSYDRTTGNPLVEQTDEYFFRDVVSVATKSDTQQIQINAGLKGKEEVVKLTASESFVLTTSGGTAFEVFLFDPALLKLKSTKRGKWSRTEAENAIQTIRTMLRDKKRSPAPPPVQASLIPQPTPIARGSNPGPAGDSGTKLKKLKQLLDDGLIDQEEFKAQKQRLLDSL